MKKIHHKIALFLTIIFLVTACQSLQKSEQKPSNLIDEEHFEQLLTDLEKAEAYIHMQYAKQNNISPESVYLSVFAKHHTTKADFDSSLSYYANHPEFLEESYNRILEKITKEQAEISVRLSKQKENEE